MDTSFSAEIRVLLCSNCGAALQMGLSGGQAQCQYCRAVNQAGMRDERPLVDPAMAATRQQISEDERIARLRMQDGKPLLPPPSLAPLFAGGAQLPPWKKQEALAVWQGARQELRTNPTNYDAGERLLFLTMVLANQLGDTPDPVRERAMFESALDVMSLPRHRQIMRGYLSRNATRVGDLAAAERWLAPCDSRADELDSDTSYRFSRALLDTAKRDYNSVLRTLGGRAEDVPTMDAMDAVCTVLRANAWEKMGQPQASLALLQQGMSTQGASGRVTMEKFIAMNPSFQLCAQTFPQATQQHAQVAGRVAATAATGGIHTVFVPLGALMMLGAVACIAVLIASAFVDLGPAAGMGSGIALVTLLPMGLIFGGIGLAMRKAAKKAEYLRVHGVSAQARVMGHQGTGMRINGVPQVAIQLQVDVPGRGPVPAVVKMLLDPMSMHALMPGAMVPVRVDPNDPTSVMIETQ